MLVLCVRSFTLHVLKWLLTINTCHFRTRYRVIRRDLIEFLQEAKHGQLSVLREELVAAIMKKDLQNRACKMILVACTLHMFFFVFLSTFILYGIKSTLYGEIPELVERGISELWESAFLTVTAFANCGLTITSDSMLSYQDKPGVYLYVCIIILAGTCVSFCSGAGAGAAEMLLPHSHPCACASREPEAVHGRSMRACFITPFLAQSRDNDA